MLRAWLAHWQKKKSGENKQISMQTSESEWVCVRSDMSTHVHREDKEGERCKKKYKIIKRKREQNIEQKIQSWSKLDVRVQFPMVEALAENKAAEDLAIFLTAVAVRTFNDLRMSAEISFCFFVDNSRAASSASLVLFFSLFFEVVWTFSGIRVVHWEEDDMIDSWKIKVGAFNSCVVYIIKKFAARSRWRRKVSDILKEGVFCRSVRPCQFCVGEKITKMQILIN